MTTFSAPRRLTLTFSRTGLADQTLPVMVVDRVIAVVDTVMGNV